MSIESTLSSRYGRAALFMPSGRLALHLGLTAAFPEGGRLLMSPLDDDVVAMVVLAAGLRPVMAPVEPASGNLDADAVTDAMWADVDGVLTTNLYGIVEQASTLRAQCDRHGILLVEDVAHALVVDDEQGRPVGHAGDLVIVSLSKHGRGPGGGALLGPAELVDPLRRRAVELTRRPTASARLRRIRAAVERRIGIEQIAGRARRRVVASPRVGHRMVVDEPSMQAVAAAAPDLEAADRWIGIDRRRYRDRIDDRDRKDALVSVRRAQDDVIRRRAGVARLAELEAAAPAVVADPGRPLFRVPLLVEDRDRAVAAMTDAGLAADYIYDPPLDDVFGPALVDPTPTPAIARHWGTHVLPIDPLDADRFLERCVGADRDIVRPAPALGEA